MVNQRGSILVAVVALSIVLALAAGSLMLVVGNSRFDEDSAFLRQRCFNDAESGLMIGVGWLRHSSPTVDFINGDQPWAGNAVVLFSDIAFDNGSQVTVTVRDNVPAVAPNGSKTVISRAVNGSEVTQLSWDVDARPLPPAEDGFPIVSLTNWRSP